MTSKLVVPLAASLLLCACAHKPSEPATTLTWAAAAAAEVERSDELTAVDIAMTKLVLDVELSPDAKQVAYLLRVPDALDEPGRGHNQIWLVDAAGKNEPRRLTAEGHSSSRPRWSADSRTLSFVSRRPGDANTRVYTIPVSGGEAEVLFEAPGSVSSYEWSPDGSQLAFTSAQETDAEAEARKSGRDVVIDEAGGTKTRLFVWTRETDAIREIPSNDKHVIDFAWAPDSTRLAVRASDQNTVDQAMMYASIYTASIASNPDGEPAKGLTPLTKTAGKLGAMAWSPDGKQLAFLGAADIHDSLAGIVWLVGAEGGEAKALTAALEQSAIGLEWREPGRILVLAEQGTRTTISSVSPKGEVKTLLGDGPNCFDISVGPKGALACAGDTPTHPREVFAGKLGGRLSRLSVSNPGLMSRKLGDQSVVRWQAEDGLELEGILIKPVGYQTGTQYPLAVLPHGGPEGVSINGWTTRTTYPAQLFATRGYMVFMPNYRGSAGRGTAFATADHKDLGGKEFTDVLAGIDHLVAEGLVNGDRVGMGGWSYGGYFSGLAATTYSSRFKAAVVAAAITNWISFTGTTEIEHENSLVHWNLWPWDDMDLAWERSPLAHVKGSTTATLVVHGLADTRVPVGQSLELYRALRHLGTTTQLLMYPREGHGISENVHGVDFAERFVEWFDVHVKGGNQ